MILFPFTKEKVSEHAVHLLERHAGEVVRAEIDPADRYAYAKLLREAWLCEGDLIVIEHDIGIHAGVIPGFKECRQPWCGHPYWIGGQTQVCMGCTRFTANLKAAQPDLMERATAIGQEDGGAGVMAGDWARLDVRIAATLQCLGHHPHYHYPEVDHYHYPPYASAQAVGPA